MSSAYRKPFLVPDGFQQLLKDFAREVIRHQPDNIYGFGAKYFDDLIEQRRRQAVAGDAPPQYSQTVDVRNMSQEELEQFFMQLFREADVDGNGVLDAKEFKQIMKTADLGLSNKQILEIMVEADENDDGKIDYQEFVPVAVQVVSAMYAKAEAMMEQANRQQAATAAAEDVLLHGMTREEVENMLETLFRAADSDGSGKLSRREFRECLKHTDLGLTRKEINAIMVEVDVDHDGLVSYEEFRPLCFSILVERFKTQVLEMQQSGTELDEFLLETFAAGDPEGTGFLSYAEVRDLLRGADLGLTRMQIYSIMSAAEQDADGLINYRVFVPTAASMISKMLAISHAGHRAVAIANLAALEDAELMRGIDQGTFENALMAEFAASDPDGSGTVTRGEFKGALESGAVQLSGKEVNTLLSAVDVDAAGRINYTEFVSYAYGILVHMAREARLEERIAQEAAMQ
eukprot:tig00001154_g7290.t1